MRDCGENRSLAVHHEWRRHRSWRLLSCCAIGAIIALVAFDQTTRAQDPGELPAFEGDATDAGPPITQSGGGDFFSQDLGTLLRARYSTESYGQDQNGNLDIGTMRVGSYEGATAFFDGQVTLNNRQHVGFDLGVGVRWMGWTPFALEPERITGFNIWADGTSTYEGGFFPQIGLGYESLGDVWDLRVNGYIPVGARQQVGDFEPTGDIGFSGNFIVDQTIANRSTSFNEAELEVARRLGNDRDAWAFGGTYVLANDDEDTAGYRLGVRGYAYPDLLLQFAVTDDDIFKTNATFSITWFIGRTRTDFQPACGLADRMREPVQRNDYVVLKRDQVNGGIPLTNSAGDDFRVVHVNSAAPNGGDGTFEHPLNNVGNVNGVSQDGDIVLMWSNSTFTAQNTLALKDNQRGLGEGDNKTFQIVTQEEGTIDIPETSPGAQAGARPIILNALGDAVSLADANEVANLEINGGTRGIVAGTNGSGNPNLHDLNIHNTTGDGIVLTPFVRTDTTNTNLKTVAFNVTIDTVTFDNVGGNEMNVNAFTSEDLTDPNVTLLETIALSNITSTNGGSRGLLLQNTHDPHTATITNYSNTGGGEAADGVLRFVSMAGDLTMSNVDIKNNVGFAWDFKDSATTSAVQLGTGSTYDGGTGAAGGMRFDNFDGTFAASNTTLTNGTLSGVRIQNDSKGTFNFATTVSMMGIDATSVDVDGLTGILTVNNDITNDAGRSVSLQHVSTSTAQVTFSGDITDNMASQGILVNNNSGGTILFAGDVTSDLTNATSIAVTNNTGADVSFAGALDLKTTGTGGAFLATGGGTITASGTTNKATTNGATIVDIENMTVSNAGVNFSEVNTSSAANAVKLVSNTGGPILIGTVGDNAGDSGTLNGLTDDAVVITNSANATVSGLIINSAAGKNGVTVTKSTSATQTVNLNDLNINNGANGVSVDGTGATGALVMTISDTNINKADLVGLKFNAVNNGTSPIANSTVQVNNVKVDGAVTNDTNTGVEIMNSNAAFTFDQNTAINNISGSGFELAGGSANVTFNADISSTATGRTVNIHNNTGGTATFTSSNTLDENGLGMLVQNNTGGTFNFLGTNDFDPAAAATQAILLDNNAGATVTLASLNILATGATKGLVATNGGTLNVTGLTNQITTVTGVGLDVEDMDIGAADFQSVTVNGAANGIIMRNTRGGQIAVGNSGAAQNSGGSLTTTGDAIILEDVANADLRHIRIVSAGGQGVNVDHTSTATHAMDVTIQDLNLDASTGNGIDVLGANGSNAFNLKLLDSDLERNVNMSVTGAGAFGLLVDNNDINTTGTDVAFALAFSGSAQTGNVTIRNGNNFTAADASALSISTAGATGKTIAVLVENSNFLNSSLNATSNILAGGTSLMNTTIQGNSFDDGNAGGSDFLITSTGAQARMRLNLGGDVASEFNQANGVGNFDLVEVPGSDFDVFEKTATFANTRNTGTVVPNPNAAAFDDLPTAPPLPIVPP